MPEYKVLILVVVFFPEIIFSGINQWIFEL